MKNFISGMICLTIFALSVALFTGLQATADSTGPERIFGHSRYTGLGTFTQTLAPGDLGLSNVDWDLHQILIHADAAGAGTMTLTMDANAGAAYDQVLTPIGMVVTDLITQYDPPLKFSAGDEIDLSWSNAGTVLYGIDVTYSFER